MFPLQAFWKLVNISLCLFSWCTGWNFPIFQWGPAIDLHSSSRNAECERVKGAGATGTLLTRRNTSAFPEKSCSCLLSAGITGSLLRHPGMQTSSTSMNRKVTAHTVITTLLPHFSCCYINPPPVTGSRLAQKTKTISGMSVHQD